MRLNLTSCYTKVEQHSQKHSSGLDNSVNPLRLGNFDQIKIIICVLIIYKAVLLPLNWHP